MSPSLCATLVGIVPPDGAVSASSSPSGWIRNDETELLPALTANRKRWSSLTMTAPCEPSPAPVPLPPVAYEPAGVREPSPPRSKGFRGRGRTCGTVGGRRADRRGTRARRALLGAVAAVVLPGVAAGSAPATVRAPEPASPPTAESSCPGGEDTSARLGAQERTLRCLINFARRQAGLRPLRRSPLLSVSASLKARDLERCRELAHTACGKEARAAVAEAGYPEDAAWAETLYAATDPGRAARAALDRWLASRGHRRTILDRRWTEQGVALLPGTELDRATAIWVAHFGAG